jgi:hypothetical protein
MSQELIELEKRLLIQLENAKNELKRANNNLDNISINSLCEDDIPYIIYGKINTIINIREDLKYIRDKLNEQERMIVVINLPDNYVEETFRKYLDDNNDLSCFPFDKLIPIDKNAAYILLGSRRHIDGYFKHKVRLKLIDIGMQSKYDEKYSKVELILLSEYKGNKL